MNAAAARLFIWLKAGRSAEASRMSLSLCQDGAVTGDDTWKEFLLVAFPGQWNMALRWYRVCVCVCVCVCLW